MPDVRINPVAQRRAQISADLGDAQRRIHMLQELAEERDLNLEEKAALKQAQDDEATVKAAAIEEYKGDPAHVLAVGDRAIADNPLNAPQQGKTDK